MNQLQREALVKGALDYAASDKSDPFAAARCMAHINSGIASIFTERQGNIVLESGYAAELYQETRQLPDGTKYHVPAYKNVKRP